MQYVIALIVLTLLYVIIHMIRSNTYTANDKLFSQAGVKIDFTDKTITIKGKKYDVNAVQGVSITDKGRGGSIITINVDDFKKPVHKIGISAGGGAKFMQRLFTALRKADGPSFY